MPDIQMLQGSIMHHSAAIPKQSRHRIGEFLSISLEFEDGNDFVEAGGWLHDSLAGVRHFYWRRALRR